MKLALAGFAETRGPDMRVVYSRIQAAVGVYVQADHEMVLNAQRGVSSALDPRDHMPGGRR